LADSREVLAHTADVKIRLTSETLPGLFKLGVHSLNQLLKPEFNAGESNASITEQIQLQAPDSTSLLIDFLSEVLTLSQIDKAIFSEFKIDKMSDYKLSAVLKGTPVDSFDEDVKAVTYHEANVKVNQDGNWETIIIFDI
jgi:SHS2 domain-containing protein